MQENEQKSETNMSTIAPKKPKQLVPERGCVDGRKYI